MESIINALREILGTPEFYTKLGNQTNYTWDYGAMMEYFFAGLILCIVVCAVFRFIVNAVKR